nr:uncharacterized protein LOC109176665 [Ipomoea batatas]
MTPTSRPPDNANFVNVQDEIENLKATILLMQQQLDAIDGGRVVFWTAPSSSRLHHLPTSLLLSVVVPFDEVATMVGEVVALSGDPSLISVRQSSVALPADSNDPVRPSSSVDFFSVTFQRCQLSSKAIWFLGGKLGPAVHREGVGRRQRKYKCSDQNVGLILRT